MIIEKAKADAFLKKARKWLASNGKRLSPDTDLYSVATVGGELLLLLKSPEGKSSFELRGNFENYRLGEQVFADNLIRNEDGNVIHLATNHLAYDGRITFFSYKEDPKLAYEAIVVQITRILPV